MNMGMYLRMSIWDFLLVCIAGVSLTYVMLDSFYINPTLQFSVLPGIIAVVVLAVLFLIAFNGRTARIGGAVFAVCCVIAVVVAIALSPSNFISDSEQTYFYFALVVILVPLLTFGLSRSHVGSVVLFGAGAFICAWMQFFYEFYEIVWTLLFVISALMLVIYKNYQQCARSATSVRKLSFSAGFVVALCAVGAAVGLACIAWFGIIAPLNPEALEIKLITEYRALEEVEVLGTSSEEMMPNMDLTSDQTTKLERSTDDLIEDENGTEMPAREVPVKSSEEQKSGTFMGIDIESVTQVFDPKTYDETIFPWWLLSLLIIPLLIVVYFVARRVYRGVWLRRIQKLPYDEQVSQIFLFLIGKFERIGISVPEGMTLSEFARNNQETMSFFTKLSGVSFVALTDAYVSSVYGKREMTALNAEQFAHFYKSFWKAARKKLGNLRYFVKSFRL